MKDPNGPSIEEQEEWADELRDREARKDKEMKNSIVAFLQNMWVWPRSVATVTKHGPVSDTREAMIAYALFRGCLTGRRLKAAFGDLCDEIVWQEANPTVADNPKTYYPPDAAHVRAVLAKHEPAVVLCFTMRGMQEVYGLCQGREFISAPHPAARGANVPSDLMKAAGRLKTILNAKTQSRKDAEIKNHG